MNIMKILLEKILKFANSKWAFIGVLLGVISSPILIVLDEYFPDPIRMMYVGGGVEIKTVFFLASSSIGFMFSIATGYSTPKYDESLFWINMLKNLKAKQQIFRR